MVGGVSSESLTYSASTHGHRSAKNRLAVKKANHSNILMAADFAAAFLALAAL
jgi:hypothetical protein